MKKYKEGLYDRGGKLVPRTIEKYLRSIMDTATMIDELIYTLKKKEGIQTYCKNNEERIKKAVKALNAGRKKIIEGAKILIGAD